MKIGAKVGETGRGLGICPRNLLQLRNNNGCRKMKISKTGREFSRVGIKSHLERINYCDYIL